MSLLKFFRSTPDRTPVVAAPAPVHVCNVLDTVMELDGCYVVNLSPDEMDCLTHEYERRYQRTFLSSCTAWTRGGGQIRFAVIPPVFAPLEIQDALAVLGG